MPASGLPPVRSKEEDNASGNPARATHLLGPRRPTPRSAREPPFASGAPSLITALDPIAVAIHDSPCTGSLLKA